MRSLCLAIPSATQRRLASVPNVGEGRHNHARDISFALVGEGWPEADVFDLLRPLYDPRTFPDGELRGIIAGARKRNPQPARRRGGWRPQRQRPAEPRKDPARIPVLHAPTDAEMASIVDIRRIGIEAVRLCASRGLLWCATICGFASWVVADATRRGMQARRLDGMTFPAVGNLGERKTHNPAGTSTRHPVGLPGIAGATVVLLVEGSADLIAAHQFIHAEGREVDAAAVAILGAGLSIPTEDLPAFACKRVRIFPHTDPEGMAACERWARQLGGVSAKVDAFRLAGLRRGDRRPVTDLNDLTQIHPDDFETVRAVWSLIP